MAIDITQVKTIFDLESIIERCFREAEKAGYVKSLLVLNQPELIRHISMTIIGELHELEIVRRLVPIFRENRALSAEFLLYGDSYQLFYDKTVQDKQLHGLRVEPETGG